MPAAQDRPHWSVSKQVNISHIISTMVIAGTAFMFIMRLETQIRLTEQRLDQLEVNANRVELSVSSKIDKGFDDLRRQIQRLDDKLDGKQDKGSQ